MAKHIPGPWEVCRNPTNEYWFAGRTIGAADPGDARRICDLPVLAHPDQNEANGRLICAAPDLLWALQSLLIAQTDAEEHAAIILANDAIAKATS